MKKLILFIFLILLFPTLCFSQFLIDGGLIGGHINETDPVVGAINGIVKADGGGNISAAGTTGTGNVVLDNSPTLISPSLGTNPLTTTYTNDTSTGTTQYKIAKLTGAPSTVIIGTTTDIYGGIGICFSGCGKAGTAEIATRGQVSCIFDGATTAGNWVQFSTSVDGDCHDAGSTYPIYGQVLGRVLSTNGGTGTYAMQLFGPGIVANPVRITSDSSGAYTVLTTDDIVHLTTAGTCVLPTPVGVSGRLYDIKNASAGTITVSSAAGNINGAATFAILGSPSYEDITIYSDGSNWWIK